MSPSQTIGMRRIIVYCTFSVVVVIFSVTNTSARFQHGDFSSVNDSTVMKHYHNAVELFNAHDDTGELLEEAKEEFLTVLTLNAQHAPSIAYLGLIALGNDDVKTADSLFRVALSFDSSCPEARVGRAQAFRKKMQWQSGYDEARLAVKLAPASMLARWELVDELIHRAEAPVTDSVVEEVVPHLKFILEADSNAREAHLDLARMYEHRTQWREAAAQYREVLRIGQTDDDMDVWVYTVHLDAARCFEQCADYTNAIEELKLYLAVIKEYESNEEEVHSIENHIQELRQKNNR